MASSPAVWIGLRYVLSRANRNASFVNLSSIVGIASGVMLLIAVASITNGLVAAQQIGNLKILAHGFVPAQEAVPSILKDLLATDGVAGIGEFYRGDAMLSWAGRMHPIKVLGFGAVSTEDVEHISRRAHEVTVLKPGSIALAVDVAVSLGINEGDAVMFIVPTIRGREVMIIPVAFRLQEVFEPRGYFEETTAIARLADLEARGLTRGGEAGWRIWLEQPMDAENVLEGFDGVRLWTDEHGLLFSTWRLEKNMMLVILLLVLVLGSFSIASGQVMLINQKRADIGILSTMGADRRFVFQALLSQGLVVSFVGLGLGVAMGCLAAVYVADLVAALEWLTGHKLLDSRYFKTVPVEILWTDLIAVVVVAGTTCGIASVRPVVLALREETYSMLNQ